MSNMGPIGQLATYTGIPEPALRLFLSILAGYPLARIYVKLLRGSTEVIKHLFCASTGFYLCVFNYGFEAYHSLIAIGTTYLLARLMHTSRYFVAINFAFHMGYLLTGYFFTESDDYDIKWTMPHCVMVLRLIGFGFDISDGRAPKESLSKDQKETALQEIPSILELAGFTYFPASFLVGPQFPYRRYKNFIVGTYDNRKSNIEVGLKRGALGILYLVIRQYGASLIPDDYFFSDDFKVLGFPMKLFVVGIWAKISLYKYISCWLLAEGALTCFGLSYNGVDQNGNEDWSGCTNVKLRIFETASKMNHYVLSFNVNTNHWVAQYVYKRLKFVGNRTVSYGAALLFLAIWHGFHTGYYICFFLEYLVITFEKQFEAVFEDLRLRFKVFDSAPAHAFYSVGRRVYTHVCMGWCLIPFIYLSYSKWILVFSIFNYYGFIFLGSWFVFYFIYKTIRQSRQSGRPASD